MHLKRKLLADLDTAASLLGLRVLSRAEYTHIKGMFLAAERDGPPPPAGALDYLRADNPRLDDLRKRYQSHPGAAHSHWDERKLLGGLKLHDFRRDSPYVWQTQWTKPETYLLTAYYLRDHDRLGLLGRLLEDGLFGATTVPFENGYLLSRDLLDSINEINLVARWFGLNPDSAFSLLDIGAGYGRLAHRLITTLANATVVCADAVPVSSFLCEYYLGFRGLGPRAEVIALDRAEEMLAARRFDLVTNIHSFSECPASAIEWWLQCLDRVRVDSLLIVPNDGEQLLSLEPDGARRDFEPLLDQHSWRAARREPIYLSDVAQRHALFPTGSFRLFVR